MNKLKIFLTTFALCIMSVGFSFADSPTSRIVAPNGTTYKYYAVVEQYTYYFNELNYIKDSTVSGVVSLSFKDFLKYDNGVLKDYGTGSTSMNVYPDAIKETDNKDIKAFLGQLDVIPPTIAPTIQGAIQGVVPTFSKQLLAFLPKALLIFSMVLSIPLIPRVIRLFF